MPASVYQQLKNVMPRGNFETKYQLLFTIPAFPGVALPLVAGAVVDRVEARVCLLFLSFFCLVGQITAAVGVRKGSWPVTYIGRFIYGIGFEPLFVTIQKFFTMWLYGAELGRALGISTGVSYTGYLLSFLINPAVANGVSAPFSFWVGAMIMAVSVLAALVIFAIDRATQTKARRRDRTMRSSQVQCVSLAQPIGHVNNEETLENGNAVVRRKEDADSLERTSHHEGNACVLALSKFSCSFWLLSISCLLLCSISFGFAQVSSGLLLERNLFKEAPGDCTLSFLDQCSSGYLAPAGGNAAIWPDGTPCPVTPNYAPVLPTSLTITRSHPSWDYSEYIFEPVKASDVDCTDPFWADACTKEYCERQDEATEKAGFLMSIPFVVTVATSFLFGHYCVDKMGLRAEMVASAFIFLVVAHSIFAFQSTSFVPPLIVQGIGYSMGVSALWPSVPFTVDNDVIGKGFGLMTCIQNAGYCFFPPIVAAIYNNFNHRYVPGVELFFLCSSAIGILVGIALVFVDKRAGGKLGSIGRIANSEV